MLPAIWYFDPFSAPVASFSWLELRWLRNFLSDGLSGCPPFFPFFLAAPAKAGAGKPCGGIAPIFNGESTSFATSAVRLPHGSIGSPRERLLTLDPHHLSQARRHHRRPRGGNGKGQTGKSDGPPLWPRYPSSGSGSQPKRAR